MSKIKEFDKNPIKNSFLAHNALKKMCVKSKKKESTYSSVTSNFAPYSRYGSKTDENA